MENEIKKSKFKMGVYVLLPSDTDKVYSELQKINKYLEIYYATCKEFMHTGQLIFYVAFKRTDDAILNIKVVEYTDKTIPHLFRETYKVGHDNILLTKTFENRDVKYDSILVLNEFKVPSWAEVTNFTMNSFNESDYFFRCHGDIQANFGLAIKAMIWNFEYNGEIKKRKIASLSACTQDRLKIGGEQSVEIQSEYKGDLLNLSSLIHNNYLGKIRFTGPHKHFFECISMKAFKDIGCEFNTEYEAFGDDIEWSLRAFEKGYGLVVCQDTFVWHDDQDFDPGNLEDKNGLKFRNKIKLAKYETKNKYDNRYVFLYILDNVEKDLGNKDIIYRNIEKMLLAGVDKIIVYDSGNLNDTIKEMLKAENQRVWDNKLDFKIRNKNIPYDELVQFTELIQYIQSTYNPKWIGVLDKNEGLSYEFDKEYLDRLYNPPDPTIFAYSLPIIFHWVSPDYYRSDGDWGENWEVRIFRNLSFYNEVYKKDDYKPYAERSPLYSLSVTEPINLRIRCYGYMTQEQRDYIYNWMIEHDKTKNVMAFPKDDKKYLSEVEQTNAAFYKILNQKDIALRPYREQNNIDGVITSHSKNDPTEEITIIGALKSMWGVCKNIYFQDNGCTDWSLKVADTYGCHVMRSPQEWFWGKGDPCEGLLRDFSVWANSYRSFCKEQWVLRISADEYFKSKRDQQLLVKFTNFQYNYIYVWISSFMKGDKKYSQDRVCLYENRPEFKYTRMVHETFHDALEIYHPKLNGLRPTYDQINLTHLGYLKKPEYLEKKFTVLYHRLNEMAYKRDKTDGMAAYNLGMEYVTDGNEHTAKQYLHEATKRNEKLPQPWFQLWAYSMEEARKYADKYVEHCVLSIDEKKQFLQKFLDLAKDFQIETLTHYDGQKNIVPLVKIK